MWRPTRATRRRPWSRACVGQAPIMLICTDAGVKVILTVVDALDGYDVFDEEDGFGQQMMDRKLPDLAAELAELVALGKLAGAED